MLNYGRPSKTNILSIALLFHLVRENKKRTSLKWKALVVAKTFLPICVTELHQVVVQYRLW